MMDLSYIADFKFLLQHCTADAALGDLSACLQRLALSQLANHTGRQVLLGAGCPTRAMPGNKLLAYRRIWVHLDMCIRAVFCRAQALQAHTPKVLLGVLASTVKSRLGWMG